ncbi:MAG: sel1 repeat family protein [Ruminococcus sp.]|nr:sel1 repeat family protein [Ruminococcus sp.]
MDISQANKICRDFANNCGNYTDEDLFMFTEAAMYIITETQDPRYICYLGGVYYENKKYDLALKYYEMAAEYDHTPAFLGLGYIWYYGRTGKVDYRKAYEYYSRAGYDINAWYKLADMYKNGYYVKADYHKYKEIIEDLYLELEGSDRADQPYPEVCTRLAGIREEEGRTDEAVELLRKAKSMLRSRIGFDPFFGNYSIMVGIINDLYRLTEFDEQHFDLYDLYYLFKKPVKIKFTYNGEDCFVESVQEPDGSLSVKYGEHWYRSVDAFLKNAKIDDKRLTMIPFKLSRFEVV